jgi:hypothetical protein
VISVRGFRSAFARQRSRSAVNRAIDACAKESLPQSVAIVLPTVTVFFGEERQLTRLVSDRGVGLASTAPGSAHHDDTAPPSITDNAMQSCRHWTVARA